jgi:hypothetical protein
MRFFFRDLQAFVFFTSPQSRHPERSSSRSLRAAESKDPEGPVLGMLMEPSQSRMLGDGSSELKKGRLYRQHGLLRGPSTLSVVERARFAKCAKRSAQDDDSEVIEGPKQRRSFVAAGLLVAALTVPMALPAQEISTAKSDPLLVAMQQELAREQKLLVLPGMQRPYFMEYRLEDLHTYEAVANYGALTSEGESYQRVVRVQVRIGDYTSDSSSARGDGSLQLAPSDNDLAALKYALWTATDEAYKNALRAYSTKQAALKQFQSAPTANDFTPGKPVTLIEPLKVLDLDRAEWKRRIMDASGLFETAP